MNCPICGQPPKLKQITESLECPVGHIVCAACKFNSNGMTKCPLCRNVLSVISQIRRRQARQLLYNYNYECQFYGCNCKFIESKLITHEKVCPRKMIVCPWKECTSSEILERDIIARVDHARHLDILETYDLDYGWDFPVSINSLLNKDCVIKDYNSCAYPKLLLLRNKQGQISRHFRMACIFHFQKFQFSAGDIGNTVNMSLEWIDNNALLVTPRGKRYLYCKFRIVIYDHVCFGQNYIITDAVVPKFKRDHNPFYFLSGTTITSDNLLESLKRNLISDSFCKVCPRQKDPRAHPPHFHVRIQKM